MGDEIGTGIVGAGQSANDIASVSGKDVAKDVGAGIAAGTAIGTGIVAAGTAIASGVIGTAAAGVAMGTGVAIGAAIGNAIPIPGIGAAIGAVVGLVVGFVKWLTSLGKDPHDINGFREEQVISLKEEARAFFRLPLEDRRKLYDSYAQGIVNDLNMFRVGQPPYKTFSDVPEKVRIEQNINTYEQFADLMQAYASGADKDPLFFLPDRKVDGLPYAPTLRENIRRAMAINNGTLMGSTEINRATRAWIADWYKSHPDAAKVPLHELDNTDPLAFLPKYKIKGPYADDFRTNTRRAIALHQGVLIGNDDNNADTRAWLRNWHAKHGTAKQEGKVQARLGPITAMSAKAAKSPVVAPSSEIKSGIGTGGKVAIGAALTVTAAYGLYEANKRGMLDSIKKKF